MELNEYQKHVLRTANRAEYPKCIGEWEDTRAVFDAMVWGLGLTGEAGEVADLLKKGIGHGHGVDVDKLKKELGDVLWYIGALAHAYGLSLDDVAWANVSKLKARYPEGFTVEASKAKADEHAARRDAYSRGFTMAVESLEEGASLEEVKATSFYTPDDHPPLVDPSTCVHPDLCTMSAPCTFHSCSVGRCYCFSDAGAGI